MRVLVTGIDGFVGSHLTELLLKEEAEVFGLVLQMGNCPNLEDIILGDQSKSINPRLFKCDILDFDTLYEIIKEIQPDEIYHLAGISNIPRSLDKPDLAFEVNFNGTRRLLDAVLKSGQNPKILFVGSADSYGDISPDDLPITEKLLLKPISPYGLSKAAADLLAYQYFRTHGLQIMRVRPFNHIGPRQATSFACPSFAEQIALIEAGQKEPVLLTGNLKNQKDFTDVRDVVRAYRLILRHGKGGELFNVCSGKAFSIEFILNKMVEISGLDIEIRQEQKRLRKIDIPLTLGDNSALKSRVGWTPVIPIEQTLKDILDYHRSLL